MLQIAQSGHASCFVGALTDVYRHWAFQAMPRWRRKPPWSSFCKWTLPWLNNSFSPFRNSS
uniref:Uncharacterized protein n=1 Tax=Arundo donax TaxID=35708 RepID=A0A0A8ZUX8_ARUDO